MLKMDNSEITIVFDEVRGEYCYPPFKLEFNNKTNLPFYINNAIVSVNPTLLPDNLYAKSIFRHEIGHMHFYPIDLFKSKQLLEIAKKEINTENNDLAHEVVNIVGDCVVDYEIKNRFNDNLTHRLEVCIQQVLKLNKGQLPDRPLWQTIMSYYNCLCGKEFVKFTDEMAELGSKIHKIVIDLSPIDLKTKKICKLLKDIIQQEKDRQQKENEQQQKQQKKQQQQQGKGKNQNQQQEQTEEEREQQIEQQIIELIRGIMKQISTENTPIQENMIEDKEQIKRELEQLLEPDDKTGKTKEIVIMFASRMGVELDDFEYYRMLAHRNILFKLKTKSMTSGRIIKGGLMSWGLDDNPEDLDLIETIQNTGVAIPELTTLQFDKKHGFDEQGVAPNRIMLILDTSGSMDKEKAIVTCFSFIEACSTYNCEVGVVLFTYNPYLAIPFSRDYEKVERRIYEEYQDGGTHILPAVKIAKQLLETKSGSLVLLISDLLSEGLHETMQELEELTLNNTVNIIQIEDRIDSNYKSQIDRTLNQFKINTTPLTDLKDLDNVIIDSINDYAG